MAVSQYLRPGSLLESVQSYLTPNVIHSASSLVGESESSTRQTMTGAAAGVLSGVTNMASSREGAGNLAAMIREGGYGSVIDNAGSFAGGNTTTSVLSTGHQLLGKIFGGNAAPAAEAVAKSGGVRASSATKLMSLVAPLVMGVLAKRTAAQKLDSSGLANLLQSEKSDIAGAAPAGFSQLLSRGPALVSSAAPAPTATYVHEETDPRYVAEQAEPVRVDEYAETTVAQPPRRRSGLNWLPALIAALVILGLIWALSSRLSRRNVAETATRGVDATRRALEEVHLPGGGSISVAPGSLNYDLAKYLGDPSAAAPKTFVFDNLNFESNTTNLTPASTSTVDNLGSILKAYPNARVQLVGHTDNTGSAEANQTLSLNRADAVKTMLVGQGVSADRIDTQGMGQDHPIASNDTEEGRQRNRRTELVVTNK